MTKIPRKLLPQIPGDKIDEFIEFLKGYDVESQKKLVKVSKLKPIQSHVNREKVEKIKEKINKKQLGNPIIISKDGFIIDGHHRWIATKELNIDSIKCIEIDENLKNILLLSYLFDGTEFKNINENRERK